MQLAGRPVSKAPAPRTTLPPTHAAFHGGVGHAIQAAARAPVRVAPAPRSVGRAVQHAAAPAYHPPGGIRLAGRPGPEQHAKGGGSDIQTSGAAYGRAQADAYKKSASYRRAVVETFLHQPNPQKMQILRGAARNPTFEGKLVLDAADRLGPLAFGGKLSEKAAKTGGVGQALSDVLGTVEKSGLLGKATGISTGGALPSGLTSALGRGVIDVGRASLESPATIPKTVTGLGRAAVGSAAALAQLPVNVVTEGPGKTFSDLAHGMARDYSARYGPLVAGNDRAFINRIKQQGAGPEALDALGLVGLGDATVGRGLTGLAKTREALGGREAATGFLTRDRPALRTAGGDVRPQNLARGAGKITAQRVEDKLRAVKESRRPGEIQPHPGEVRPLFGNRSQRILASGVSAKYRRLMQQRLDTEVRAGAQRSLVRLSAAEKHAAPVALEGIIPLDRGVQAATDAIDTRMRLIEKNRENPKSLGNHIPPEFADRVDELRTLQKMKDTVPKWLTPKLRAFVAAEGERAGRLEHSMPDSYLRQPVAEARRLRPQGEMLGIEHPDIRAEREAQAAEVAARKGTAPKSQMNFRGELNRERKAAQAEKVAERAPYDERRPGLLQDYSAQVRAAAQAKGLPEPAYVPHRDVPAERLGKYTSGTGHRAMPAAKQTNFTLFHAGTVDRNPSVYLEGLANNVKVGHQYPLVDEQARRSSLPEPSATAIRAAGFGGRRADKLTGREYLKAMMFDGHRAENLMLYNPGRLRESTLQDRGIPPRVAASRAGGAPPELETSQGLHDLLSREAISGDQAAKLPENDPFLKTTGWKALPPAAYKEIHSSLQPSGLGGRLLGRAQGLTAAAILGGSPSFVVMNTLAHMLLATFGTRGRILTDAAKFPVWWHGLSEEQRNIVRSNAGGRGRFHVERLGSTAPNQLAAGWQKLKDAGIGRFTVGNVASHASPFRILFRAEDAQSNFFRHMVYYHAAKRAALDSMAKDLGQGANAMNRLNHVFTVGPKDRIAATIANMHTAEELGRHTVNMMGDYARFTNFERKFINNRAVLFYSFMRHAARTLFYVLPLHHPIATALVGELAKLHNDEVKKMLGGADLPYAYSRLYFGKNGKLTSIDFARSSPVGSASTDLPNEGIAGAAQVIPPEIQPVLDAIYKQSPTGGQYQPNTFSLLNSYLSQSFPYRLGNELHYGTKLQQSDSIPFVHERPQVKKTAAAQAYQTAKEKALGPNDQRIIASIFGLYPKPDDIKVVAQRQNKLAASKARAKAKRSGGAGGFLMDGGSGGASSSGSGSGGFLMGGGASSGGSGGGSGGYLMGGG